MDERKPSDAAEVPRVASSYSTGGGGTVLEHRYGGVLHVEHVLPLHRAAVPRPGAPHRTVPHDRIRLGHQVEGDPGPPFVRPGLPRGDFGDGLTSPSEDGGGFEELRELADNCALSAST